jgi:hypothetical protein
VSGNGCPRALVVGLACAPLLAGCGGSTPKRDPVQEARVVAEANAFCRHLGTSPQVFRRSEQRVATIQARFAALEKTIGKTAAYLPAGRDLNEAHAARRALEAERSRPTKAGLVTAPAAFERRFDRLQLRIYDDELALGLTCDGEIARAARARERALARSTP